MNAKRILLDVMSCAQTPTFASSKIGYAVKRCFAKTRKIFIALLLSDGDDDCNDFTDETHCGAKTNCSDDQFECMNGLCVPQEWICGKTKTKDEKNSFT